MLKLVIANKNYSSWSLRAWLFLTQSQIPFEEIRLPIYTPQWYAEMGRYGAAGQVPILVDDTVTVWDTMAIFDYGLAHLGGLTPDGAMVGWPSDRQAGARARSIAAEMHAGFFGVRQQLPQNIRARTPVPLDRYRPDTQQQIERIQLMWRQCYAEYGGPWLFGNFSLADVVYAPVALRFVTYQTPLLAGATAFVEAVQTLPAIQQWGADAAAESEKLRFVDELRPPKDAELGRQ